MAGTTEEGLNDISRDTIEQLDEEIYALKGAVSDKDSAIAELKKQIATVEAHTEAARDETIEQITAEYNQQKERIDSLLKTIGNQEDEIAKYKDIIQGVAKPIIKAWLEMNKAQ